jgi:hypothetical protein
MNKLYSFQECVFDDIITEDDYNSIINGKVYEVTNQINLENLTEEIIKEN